MTITGIRRSFLLRRAWIALHIALPILGLSLPAMAHDGQESAERAGISEQRRELTRQILEEENHSQPRTIGLIRLRATYPQKISAGFGWMRVRLPASDDCRTVCGLKGPTLQVEPGLAGTQLSVGYARLIGERRMSRHFLKAVYVGFGAKAVVLRTYGDSPLMPAGQTLMGAEGDFTVASANFSFGILRSLATETKRGWIATFGLGWGF